MQIMKKLTEEFLDPMEKYRKWVFSNPTQRAIATILEPQMEKLKTGERASSPEYLMTMDHSNHDGLPGEFVGINLNSKILQLHVGQFDGRFIEEARQTSDVLDEELQNLLGAKVCALKMFYPVGGYIEWHTNWDSPGYNVVFTYSKNGRGYWRHIDPVGATSVIPQIAQLIHVEDQPGWHCKAGYFGRKDEVERVVWHSAFTREPRLTLSYLIEDKRLWENLVEELSEP